jgi:hypothetical protein
MAATRKPSTATPVDHASTAPSLRILKKGACPTVSRKSEL